MAQATGGCPGTPVDDMHSGSDLTERAARERAIKQHQAQYHRLEVRIEILYNDRLDGRINTSFYDSKAGEIRAQQQTTHGSERQVYQNRGPHNTD
jgi:hypothetical protein